MHLRTEMSLFNGDQKVLDFSNEDYFPRITWRVLLCYLPMMCPGFTQWVLASGYVSKNYRKVSNSCLKVLHNLSSNKLKLNKFEACFVGEWCGIFTGKECSHVKREDTISLISNPMFCELHLAVPRDSSITPKLSFSYQLGHFAL